jgi:transposase
MMPQAVLTDLYPVCILCSMTLQSIQSKKDLPGDYEDLRDFSWNLVLRFQRLNEKHQMLLRRYFGRSSERLGAPDQAELDAVQQELTELLAQIAPPEQQPQDQSQEQESTVEVSSHKRRRRHHGRDAIPEELITDVLVDIPDQEKNCDCGRDKYIIGYKSHIVVERIPARYKATRYLRPIYACACKREVTTAEPPAVTPIPKGLAWPQLLMFVVLSKYQYHLPLYRIQRLIFHESGIWFTRSTLMNWVKQVCSLLKRIHEQMLREYQLSRIKCADETPLRVRLSELAGKCHLGYMWAGVGCGGRQAVFRYDNSRSSKAACALIADSRAGDYLMTDDYASYNAVVRDLKLIPLLCMMHARRKFYEALEKNYKADYCRRVLRSIGHLYRLERFATRMGFSVEQRTRMRKRYSSIHADALKRLLDNPGFVVLPENPVGKAIRFSRDNWDKLSRFLESGELPIDNGATERALRALAIGRNNWLFAGSPNGAMWMAILYSIIATCKLNGIDLHQYLPDVLMRVSIRPPDADVSDLTPLGWLKQRNGGQLPPIMHLYPDEAHRERARRMPS